MTCIEGINPGTPSYIWMVSHKFDDDHCRADRVDDVRFGLWMPHQLQIILRGDHDVRIYWSLLLSYENWFTTGASWQWKHSNFSSRSILEHLWTAKGDILPRNYNLVSAHTLGHVKLILVIDLQPIIFLNCSDWINLTLIVPFGVIGARYKVKDVLFTIDPRHCKVHLLSIYTDILWHQNIVWKMKESKFCMVKTFHDDKVTSMTHNGKIICHFFADCMLHHILLLSVIISSHDAVSKVNLFEG